MNQTKELGHENRRITISETSNMLGTSSGWVQSTSKDNLHMGRISAEFMPCLEWSRRRIMSTWEDLQESLERDAEVLLKIITGDEIWVDRCNPETKRQFSGWKSLSLPHPKTARLVHSNVKRMHTVFFFQTFKVLCIINLFHKDTLQTNTTTMTP
jgi:hypothetical protein